MGHMGSYEEFIRAKVKLAEQLGFNVPDSSVNPILKPHQRDMVRWMVKMGRAACFAAFGLGKSVIQVEVVRITRPQYRAIHSENRATAMEEAIRIGRTDPALHGFVLWAVKAARQPQGVSA